MADALVNANGMETAVSLPDNVFYGAERFATRLRKTRSQLCAEAIAEYLRRHAPDEVTEDRNAGVDRITPAAPDSFTRHAARRTLRNVEW